MRIFSIPIRVTGRDRAPAVTHGRLDGRGEDILSLGVVGPGMCSEAGYSIDSAPSWPDGCLMLAAAGSTCLQRAGPCSASCHLWGTYPGRASPSRKALPQTQRPCTPDNPKAARRPRPFSRSAALFPARIAVNRVQLPTRLGRFPRSKAIPPCFYRLTPLFYLGSPVGHSYHGCEPTRVSGP